MILFFSLASLRHGVRSNDMLRYTMPVISKKVRGSFFARGGGGPRAGERHRPDGLTSNNRDQGEAACACVCACMYVCMCGESEARRMGVRELRESVCERSGLTYDQARTDTRRPDTTDGRATMDLVALCGWTGCCWVPRITYSNHTS